MNTLKKFITYYAPYKKVFFLDLLCAAFISIADPCLSAISPNTDEFLIYKRQKPHPSGAPLPRCRTYPDVPYTKSL